VLAGVSAGMLCWFSGGVTDSFGGLEPLHDGLGFLDATACPHYDGEPGRRPAYHRAIAEGMKGGYAADDGAALHFRGPTLVEAISRLGHQLGITAALVPASDGRAAIDVDKPADLALVRRIAEGGYK